MKWFKVEIAGNCFGCDKHDGIFFSCSGSDGGPWMCSRCKTVIERFLHLGNYIVSTPITQD